MKAPKATSFKQGAFYHLNGNLAHRRFPSATSKRPSAPASPGTPSSEGTFTSSLSALSFPFHPLFFETQAPKKLSLRTLSPENDPRQPLRPHSPERHQHGATHLTSNTEPPLPPAALWPLAPGPASPPPPTSTAPPRRIPASQTPWPQRCPALVLAQPPPSHTAPSALSPAAPPVNAALQLKAQCLALA